MDYKLRKPVQISPNVLKDFKHYCKENGLKMGFTLDKIIVEYIKNQG